MSVPRMSGFTIFEMMIVVAIVGIVTAFAVPEFRDMMARNRVSAAADEMLNSIASARNTAITRRRTVVVLVTTSGWEVRLDSATGTLLGSHELRSPVVANYWQAGTMTDVVTQMTFAPSGLVTKSNGTPAPLDLSIRFCDSGSRREIGKDITVSRIGRIILKKHPSAATCNPS